MDAAEHAIAEGYVTPDGAITEEGFEAFALGQGPFALRIVDKETGHALHMRTHCGRCGETCETNEASTQPRWADVDGMYIAVCPTCAEKPPPKLTRKERREGFGGPCWDPWCGDEDCARCWRNRGLIGCVRRWLWKRKHPETWQSRYGGENPYGSPYVT